MYNKSLFYCRAPVVHTATSSDKPHQAAATDHRGTPRVCRAAIVDKYTPSPSALALSAATLLRACHDVYMYTNSASLLRADCA